MLIKTKNHHVLNLSENSYIGTYLLTFLMSPGPRGKLAGTHWHPDTDYWNC